MWNGEFIIHVVHHLLEKDGIVQPHSFNNTFYIWLLASVTLAPTSGKTAHGRSSICLPFRLSNVSVKWKHTFRLNVCPKTLNGHSSIDWGSSIDTRYSYSYLDQFKLWDISSFRILLDVIVYTYHTLAVKDGNFVRDGKVHQQVDD